MKSEHTKFGDLSRDEKIKLITAWLDGKPIESKPLPHHQWAQCPVPGWSLKMYYRIKPTHQLKPSIDWDHINPQYKYLAIDADDTVCLYINKPKIIDTEWWASPGRARLTCTCTRLPVALSSFRRGKCEWQESLISRPGY